ASSSLFRGPARRALFVFVAPRGLIEILELPGVDRPEQRPHGHAQQHQAQRDQHEQNVHSSAFAAARRRALSTTTSELTDIPIAASHGGTRSNAARGTAARL